MDTYIIQQGDTLSGIARKRGIGISEILRANPSISNPNLITAGSKLVLPGTQQPTDTGNLAPASENIDLSKSGRYVIDQSNNRDVFDTQTGKILTPDEFKALGLNEKFIPRASISGSGDGTAPGEMTVDSFLKSVGVSVPGVDDGTEEAKFQSAVSVAKEKLDSLQSSLRAEIDRIDNNPFLLSSEALGEKRRVITGNQDALKGLLNAYNSALANLKEFRSSQEKAIGTRTDITKMALDQIQKRADAIKESAKNATDLQIKIQQLRNSTPAGQSFTVDGKTYTGLRKATGTDSTKKIVESFKTKLAAWDKAGTREKFISRLQFLYPEISPKDIATAVYQYYPDGYEKDVKPATPKEDPFVVAKDTVQSYKDQGFERKDIENQYKDAEKPVPLEVQKALDEIYGR